MRIVGCVAEGCAQQQQKQGSLPPKHPPPTHAPQTPQLLALELLILLLEAPSDDSVEVAVDFLKVRAVEGASEGTGGARCRHQRAPQRPTHLH